MFDRFRSDPEDESAARERMVDQLKPRIDRSETAEALRSVPRHVFVPESRRDSAYQDTPLPIGSGQTISAPHMVAEMTDQLALEPGAKVLEIGTGCGYHAAVTAEIVGADQVYSIEYHADLAEEARANLAECGYEDVSVRVGDGHDGWPAEAPFDAAYLTCAAPELPDSIIDQVKTGGRIAAPIGTNRQHLVVATKTSSGLDRETHGAVRFVPMKGSSAE